METLIERTGCPIYYGDFSCIADKCKKSCCIGWEIDIDSDTLSLYQNMEGGYSEEIKKSIKTENGSSFFVLGKDERCPHLDDTGLCNIIKEYSDTALCDICRLHPRFKNFFTGYTETGLGLSCEEAARIIVNSEEPFHIIAESLYDESLTDEEKKIIEIREDIFTALTYRELKLSERLKYICREFGINIKKLSPEKHIDKLLRLERMDEEWTAVLKEAKGNSVSLDILDSETLEMPFEQLSTYFIFRHFAKCLEDGDMESKIKFSVFSVLLLAFLMNGKEDKEKLTEYARIFSSEVEYSEENTDKLYKIF